MRPIKSPRFFAPRHTQSIGSPQTQRGVSLFIALVALVLMTISGLALMRSVDTGNVIAGNMAFREVTVHAADLGVEAAASYLDATIKPSPDANLPSGCTAASIATSTRGTCRYSARALPDDDRGITYVDWTSTGTILQTTASGVTYQYVVDRLCNPDTAITISTGEDAKYGESKELCVTYILDEGKSGASGRNAYTTSGDDLSPITPIHYRVTVRVTGPRNTVSFVQTLMAR